MSDLSGAVDLAMMRGDNDVSAGFHVSNGIYTAEVDGPDGSKHKIQMPVLDIHFHMANGKTTHRVSISPDMVMAMIGVTSNWKLALDQQVAPPPAPPRPQP